MVLYDIIENEIKYRAKIIPFKEPDPDNMLEIAEKELLQGDSFLFREYNDGVETSFYIDQSIYQYYEEAIKCLFKEKEITIGLLEDILYNSRTGITRKFCELNFIMEVRTQNRFHIRTAKGMEKTNYGKYFVNYEEKLDEYDKAHDEECKEYFTERLNKWKNKTELNLQKYELNDSDKEFFEEIFKTYNIPFTFVLKDGYLCINTYLYYEKNQEKNSKAVKDCLEQVFNIIERFMNI